VLARARKSGGGIKNELLYNTTARRANQKNRGGGWTGKNAGVSKHGKLSPPFERRGGGVSREGSRLSTTTKKGREEKGEKKENLEKDAGTKC